MLDFTRHYVLTALSGTPDVLERLLASLAPDSPLWDNRPDPDRFMLREITGHLAAWETIFLDRVTRTRDEVEPEFGHTNESELAARYDYAHSDPATNLAHFRERRAVFVALLRALPAEAWNRRCRRSMGLMSITEQATLTLAHDGYHTQQIALWLAAKVPFRV